jgi:hypothetical protein
LIKKVIKYKNWIDAGIFYVRDLMNKNGKFMSFQNFCKKFDLQEHFVTFYGVTQSIPKEWKGIVELDDTLVKPKQNKILKLQTINKVPKAVYIEMMEVKEHKPVKSLEKWNKLLSTNIPMSKWLNYFQYIYQVTDSIKHQHFQYRLMHGILTSRENLFKWGIVKSDLCTLCEEQIEDVKHIFIECEVVKIFWQRLLYWIESKLQLIVTFNSLDVLFGSLHDDLLILDVIYLVAKQYIYACKFDSICPKIQIFEKNLYAMKNMERCIAVKNNRLQKYIKKWDRLI